MTHSQTPTATRFARSVSTLTLGLAAAACGGGGDEPGTGPAASSAKALPPASVTVQGCVVDRHYIPPPVRRSACWPPTGGCWATPAAMRRAVSR